MPRDLHALAKVTPLILYLPFMTTKGGETECEKGLMDDDRDKSQSTANSRRSASSEIICHYIFFGRAGYSGSKACC
jgi:hypothetical protein